MRRVMADPIVLLALAIVAGGSLALAPVPTAAGAIALAFLLRRRARPAVIAIALAALCASGLRARAALDRAEATHAHAIAILNPPARCEGEGRVVGSPVVQRGQDASAGEPHGRADVELTAGLCGDRPIDAPLRARLYGAPEDLARGDRVFVVADLAPVHLFLDEGLADPRPGIARSGVAASGGAVEVRVVDRGRGPGAILDRARAFVRRRIEATYHPSAAPLGRALVLGETDLDPLDDQAFRLSGLAHLLAVSGTHLVIAVASVAAALRAILVRVGALAARFDVGRLASAVAIPLSWAYADFAGGSGSAVRAAAMLSAAMLARALGRRGDTARTFAWSLLVLAIVDPLLVSDVSFALSAAATAGLVVLQRPIAAVIVRGPAILKKPLGAVAATVAAMAGCTPILAVLAPSLPLLGIAANLIAAPLGELAALPLCLAHAALAWAPPVERGAALIGSGALLGVRAIARATADTGTAVPVPPPTAAELAAIAVAAAAAWVAPDRRRRIVAIAAGAAALLLLEIAAIRAGSPKGLLRVSILDVGQGDSILIDLPDGEAMLVDGGGFVGSPVDPGVRVVLPVLRSRRRSQIDLVVLSHPHPDHFTGLASVLPEIEAGELWDTGQGEDQGAGSTYAAFLAGARARGVAVKRPADLCGAPRLVGGATIEVLAPCPGYLPDAGANDNSFVIRIRYGSRAVLLTGDAERDEERAIAASGDLHADLLKVGHHGSRTSTSPELLAAVRPSFAAISSGVRNRYGHPHPLTLAALGASGIAVGRTDRGGEIVWETDGEAVRIDRPAGR
jgi:competence protein ComEC